MEDPAQPPSEPASASASPETGPGALPGPEELRRLVEAEVKRQMAAAGLSACAQTDPDLAAMAESVGIAQMAPLMPYGMRSESTLRRMIGLREVPAEKIRGRWCLWPKKVAAALLRRENARERAHRYLEVWKEAKPVRKKSPKKGFGSQKFPGKK
jgi:hypothetical protein